LVPDVHHAVELVVAALHGIDAQQPVPIGLQDCEGSVDLLCRVEVGDELAGLGLVDDLLGFPFFLGVVLHIAQREDDVALLAGLQLHLYIMAGHGAPSVGEAVARPSLDHGLWLRILVIQAHETLAVGVEALDGHVHMIEGKVVAALAVFGFVVDGRSVDLHLTRREVALEFSMSVDAFHRHHSSYEKSCRCFTCAEWLVSVHLLHFGPCMQRNEEEHAGLHAPAAARDAGVVHAVAALIAVERRLAGLPSGVPDGVAILDIEIAAGVIYRHIVVPIACDASELGILAEGISSCRVEMSEKKSSLPSS
jgi:hypothetical protein